MIKGKYIQPICEVFISKKHGRASWQKTHLFWIFCVCSKIKACLDTQRSDFNKRNWLYMNMMYGRYVNNVYSDANCNDSKTEKVIKTVFALKKKKF